MATWPPLFHRTWADPWTEKWKYLKDSPVLDLYNKNREGGMYHATPLAKRVNWAMGIWWIVENKQL